MICFSRVSLRYTSIYDSKRNSRTVQIYADDYYVPFSVCLSVDSSKTILPIKMKL